MVTRPVLLSSDGRSPILLTLKGVSFQPDLYHEKRAEIEVSECVCVCDKDYTIKHKKKCIKLI